MATYKLEQTSLQRKFVLDAPTMVVSCDSVGGHALPVFVRHDWPAAANLAQSLDAFLLSQKVREKLFGF